MDSSETTLQPRSETLPVSVLQKEFHSDMPVIPIIVSSNVARANMPSGTPSVPFSLCEIVIYFQLQLVVIVRIANCYIMATEVMSQ
jgi:hypothetical protein